MCGIAGWFGTDIPVGPERLLDALHHRGPDGRGVWRSDDGRAGLVHTRLAVIDLSDGAAQPMAWREHGQARAWLAFNGEIYNYRELRGGLEAQGERFHTQSDTEVLLRLLVREGRDALPKLAGMFAFAFYDARGGRGLLARDALGIKPLYYRDAGGGLRFASELRALWEFIGNSELDSRAVRDFLLWGTVQEPATLLEDVRMLPAGHYVEWDGGTSAPAPWYEFPLGKGDGLGTAEEAVELTRSALLESVERHLVADVPVGIFLSGGLDSTAVLVLAREALGSGADLRTFSIGFEQRKLDELDIARRTAERFGTRHTEWRMTQTEGVVELRGYLRAMDQPTVDGFNTWCVSRLARREGMKVVLSGLGGDELFGGYGSFHRLPQFLALHCLAGPLRGLLARVFAATPGGSRWRRLAAFLRGPAQPLAAFHVQRGIFTETEARRLTRAVTGEDPGPSEWQPEDLPADLREQVSRLELTRYMRNQLLRDSDVFSMAHGLELRVPLVDSRLLDALAGVPAAQRLRPGKQLLIEAVPEIPQWVQEQPKRGFAFPFEAWAAGEFGGMLRQADSFSPLKLRKWYRRWAVAVLLRQGANFRPTAEVGH